MKSKSQYREEWPRHLSMHESGRIAQRIRAVPVYRHCQQIFVEPTPFMAQVRINSLLDGKTLIMPTPGMKQGFVLIKPFTVPFPKLGVAVSLMGAIEHGVPLPAADIARLDVGLCIAEPLIMNENGMMIGDGSGYFDLAVAILNEFGGVAEGCGFLACLADASRLVREDFPLEPWDVRVQAVVSSGGYSELYKDTFTLPKVLWQALPHKKIKKIDPLWKLYCSQHPESPGHDLS